MVQLWFTKSSESPLTPNRDATAPTVTLDDLGKFGVRYMKVSAWPNTSPNWRNRCPSPTTASGWTN